MKLIRAVFEIETKKAEYEVRCYLNDANTGIVKWYVYRNRKLIATIKETRVNQFVNQTRAKQIIKQAEAQSK